MSQPIQDGNLISRSGSIVAADTADEAILLDMDSGYFFQLNRTAARIWGSLEQPRPFAELCDEIGTAYGLAPETCRAEVSAFIVELQDRGLLNVAG